MNYKIQNENKEFLVLETKTDLIIGKFKEQSEAKKLLRHLNLGGCFDGFTPTFFLKSTLKPIVSYK